MLGAMIGDIVGSRFEWDNHRSKEFELFTDDCFATDDSIMTLALGKALLSSQPDWSDLSLHAVRCMQEVGRPYPECGFGGSFYSWVYSDHPQPYNSFGNGAAMRVSACGFAAKSLEEAKFLSREVTKVTHDHPEGLKGAEATVVAIYMARNGSTLQETPQSGGIAIENAAESAFKHSGIYIAEGLSGKQHSHDAAGQQAQYNGGQTDQPGTPSGQISPLYDMHQRVAVLDGFILHGCLLPDLCPWS